MRSLSQVKNDMLSLGTENSAIEFSEALTEAVNTGLEVYIPVHRVEGGWCTELNAHCGEIFPVMFSDHEKAVVRPKDGKLIKQDINALIDAVFKNPRLAGFVIDPGPEAVYVNRKQIDALTGRKDPRLAEREWGSGIPVEYSSSDLAVVEELMDIAVDMVSDYALSHGYGIFETHRSPVYIPNLILGKDDKLYFAAIEIAIAPKMPELSAQKAEALRGFAKKANADCLYAAVGIGSADNERFAAGLALCGDKYLVNFSGFTKV